MRARDFDREKFILEEWPAALESGEFEQTRGVLNSKEGGYCCLGVACELLSRKRLVPYTHWKGEAELPEKAIQLLKIDALGEFSDGNDDDYGSLAGLNDDGKTFKEIAKKIRSIEKKKEWSKVKA